MANEKRLIDVVDEAIKRYAEDGDILQFISDVRFAVINAPTVDAVEVVRCKDCKHWQDIGKGCTDHVRCCEIGFYMIGENGYCYFGEREDNERKAD